MAKKSEIRRATLPAFLAETVKMAESNLVPDDGHKDREQLPKLFEALSPSKLTIPSEKDGQPSKEVIRQPMLMVFWDSGMGRWAVSISDKMLRWKITCAVDSLLNLAEQIESALKSGRVSVKELTDRPT